MANKKKTVEKTEMESLENRYATLIGDIFSNKYKDGDIRVEFKRADIETTAQSLGVVLPKNLGDVIYSFKYRAELPKAIKRTATGGREWVIKNIGRAKYAFVQISNPRIMPNKMAAVIKIPDATPGIVARYALDDEQALLAKLRYNRLLDIFSGVFEVSDKGQRSDAQSGFAYVLEDNDYRIAVSAGSSTRMPLAWVKISSECLTLKGVRPAVDELIEIVSEIGDAMSPTVSPLLLRFKGLYVLHKEKTP